VNVNLRSLIFSVFLVSCGGSSPPAEMVSPPPDSAVPAAGTIVTPRHVEVPLVARSGSQLSGTATFVEVTDGVRVTVQVTGAPPGKVAAHIHQNGDCSALDAKSAGEHFNPTSKPHGLPSGDEHHLGDLGNIEVRDDGSGSTEIVVKGASLQAGDPDSFLGHAIIVHEKQDDGGQPSGNAGARIGCGVITTPGR
jgi:superoxide dismutase, Cu-Zn family